MSIEIRPLRPANLADVREVLSGPRGRDSCWCQRFLGPESVDNQTAFEGQVRSSLDPIGLIAYDESRPAGWSRVAPRSTLPGVIGNRAVRRVLEANSGDDEPAWWITCFVVKRPYRGQGVGLALLRAAVDFARDHGGAVLDGHPVDVARLKAQPSPTALFTGTLSTFEAAGFREIGRTYVSRPVMRKAL